MISNKLPSMIVMPCRWKFHFFQKRAREKDCIVEFKKVDELCHDKEDPT